MNSQKIENKKLTSFLSVLQNQCKQKIDLIEKRPDLWQVIIPFYHKDGDMVEVFISQIDDNLFRISDQGFTLMRLSYTYDIDTPNKERIFNSIISSYNIQNENGNLYYDVELEHLFPALLHFIGVILAINSFCF